MNKITLLDVERDLLQPCLNRNVTGLGKFTADELVEKINMLPDTSREKVLLIHYWQRLCLALGQDNAEAADGWLAALALATHTAGFLLPKAASRVKSTKALNPAAGGNTTKCKAAERDKEIERIINQKFLESPNVRPKWFGRFADELKIAESTLVKKAGTILADLKKS